MYTLLTREVPLQMAQRVGCMRDTVLFTLHLAYTYIVDHSF